MIPYILECIAFQLVFLLIYDLFLKKETFFQWNRAYLMGTYGLSLLLPWIKIEAFRALVPKEFLRYPEYLWDMDMQGISLTETQDTNLWDISLTTGILLGGMVLAVIWFAYKLYRLNNLKRRGEVQYFSTFTKVIIQKSAMAFSFFKTIFMGDQIQEKEYESIIQHELVHIEQRHSWDLLFFELMRIVGWFNPLVYVYQNRISELHEFIADAKMAKTHKKEQYQLLLSQVFNTQNISFINQFFKSSLIKKRIVMLQKQKTKRIFQLKYLILLPLITGMLCYTSCEFENADATPQNSLISVENIEELTKEEESKVYGMLMNLSENDGDWSLVVKDENSVMKFTKSENGSYITGPNNEKIKAKLAIDSKLNAKNAFFLNAQAEYDQLLKERNRLLNTSDEKSPIIMDLDQQLLDLKNTILENMENGYSDFSENTIPFSLVEEIPVFPGCENASDKWACFMENMREHIRRHFNYPEEAQEKGIQGRVNIMFTIASNGEITTIKKRGPHELLEAEAERIIKRLPHMQPGREKGKAVNVPFTIPITFKLN